VTLFEPNTQFEDRYSLLDLRLMKSIRAGRFRFQPRLDIYNVLNGTTVFRNNTRYGPSYLQPLEIFGGRLLKFGAHVTF
jgi:hypothetical protein